MNLNRIFGSEEPSRLVAFYKKLFGDPIVGRRTLHGWEVGSSGILSIAAHDQVKGENEQPGRIIWNFESADVHGDFERFKAAGATVIQAPYNPGRRRERRDEHRDARRPGRQLLPARLADVGGPGSASTGTEPDTDVPAPGVLVTCRVPPIASSRSAMPCRPVP